MPSTPRKPIPGTTPFDGGQARKGYALNKMCFSFNSAEARDEFRRDEAAYTRRFGLNDEQALDAVAVRDFSLMVELVLDYYDKTYTYTARTYGAELINMRSGDIFMGAFSADQVMYNHFGYRTPVHFALHRRMRLPSSKPTLAAIALGTAVSVGGAIYLAARRRVMGPARERNPCRHVAGG